MATTYPPGLIGLPKRFCFAKDFWEKVEEPKRIRWMKQRGDKNAAVEKLSKMFYVNFSGTANGETGRIRLADLLKTNPLTIDLVSTTSSTSA